jgi:hypothetical protein
MSLRFTGARIRFLERMRHVVVTAEREGVPVNVLIPSTVVEHLTTEKKLSRNSSFAVVVKNTARLEAAGERAFLRRFNGSATITVELSDFAPIKRAARPMIVGHETVEDGTPAS